MQSLRSSTAARKPSLGLEAKEAVALATAVELIVHCAAETNLSAASDLHQSVNVEGTRNVICFARTSRGPVPGLVHLSTGQRGAFRLCRRRGVGCRTALRQ